MRRAPGLELLHDACCLPALPRRELTRGEPWGLLATAVDEGRGMGRAEIGRSAEGRPIFAVRFGHGTARVVVSFTLRRGVEPESEEVLAIRRGVVNDLGAAEDEDGGAGGGGDEGR